MLDRENLVRKIQFPRVVVPLAAVLTSFFNLLTNLAAVAVFVVATGVRPHWTWLLFPLLLIALCAMTTGAAMLLSALYVRFRDVAPIWEVILQVLFYGSPILYVIEVVPNETRARGDHVQPAGGAPPAGAPLADRPRRRRAPRRPSAARHGWSCPWRIAVTVCALGVWYFNREAPRIAEEL